MCNDNNNDNNVCHVFYERGQVVEPLSYRNVLLRCSGYRILWLVVTFILLGDSLQGEECVGSALFRHIQVCI